MLCICSARSAATTAAKARAAALCHSRLFTSRTESSAAISADELFLMDLNGHLLVRGAVSGAEIDAANAAVDAHADGFVERLEPDLRHPS